MQTTINGLKINYSEQGAYNQKVLLILHGWGVTAAVYDSTAKLLSQKYRVLTPEMPGFGDSETPPFAYDISDYSNFASEFLQTLGISECDLFCHSHGARTAIKLLTDPAVPIKFGKVVFTGAAGLMHEQPPSAKLKTRLYKAAKSLLASKPVSAVFPHALEDYKSRHGSPDYRAASGVMRDSMVKVINTDMRPLLPKIGQDVLLVFGENDDITSCQDGRIMEEEIPSAGLAVIPSAGHYAFLDNPALFFAVLESYYGINK